MKLRDVRPGMSFIYDVYRNQTDTVISVENIGTNLLRITLLVVSDDGLLALCQMKLSPNADMEEKCVI